MAEPATNIDVYLDEAFTALELLFDADSPRFRLVADIISVVVGNYGDQNPPSLSDLLNLQKLFAEAADAPLPALSASGIVRGNRHSGASVDEGQ